MGNPFLRRLIKEDKKDILHSSTYAKAQNKDGIGVDSVESFTKRREIDRNRTIIRGYDDSKIESESGVRDRFARLKSNADESSGKDGKNTLSLRDRMERQDVGGVKDLRNGRNVMGNNSSIGSHKMTEPISARTGVTPPARRNPGISR